MDVGPAVERDGDWFGSTINMAARVVALARKAACSSQSALDWRHAIIRTSSSSIAAPRSCEEYFNRCAYYRETK